MNTKYKINVLILVWHLTAIY